MVYCRRFIRAAVLMGILASAGATAQDADHSDSTTPAHAPAMTAPGPIDGVPALVGCSGCHLADGRSRQTGVNLTGLCAEYIVEQVAELGAGRRISSDPRSVFDATSMARAHQPARDVLDGAAEYFSRLTYVAPVKVVETAVVRQPRADDFDWFSPTTRKGRAADPKIVEVRIVETEEDEMDWTSSAYVAVASVKRGHLLVFRANRHLPACQSCHGKTFGGVGFVPPLRGRSPSYLARQLWDIKTGQRRGSAVASMQPVVAHMSLQDITDISSYLGTLSPNVNP